MSFIEKDGNTRSLTPEDYGKGGQLKSKEAELSLVVGSAQKAESFITNKQWNLLWRDADLLQQSPRPMTVYENTYVLEPNVQRFTVAKVCNAVVPQLYKGLFYADPPMLMRPRPGTSQDVIDSKSALFSYVLDASRFKTETKWGLEQMSLLGTGIWKWGINYCEVTTAKRTAIINTLSAGPTGNQEQIQVPSNDPPKVEKKTKTVPRPFFENRPLHTVLVDPKCSYGDIRHADYVIDIRYMDFYALDKIRKVLVEMQDGDPEQDSWMLPLAEEELKQLWLPASADNTTAFANTLEQSALAIGAVHHAEQVNIDTSPDLLMKKLEVLEYWDKGRKIIVLNRNKVIYSGKNPFGRVPFLSANWWNRNKSFYGMGLGLIVGQNQRVDQGTINSILKILSFGVNPVYLRRRDANAPSQMIRTGLGRVVTVDTDLAQSYKLLETPRVPAEVWSALSESEKATESASGADQALVQGSSAGPRSSMGRTATGATNLAGASATRLDGPLDNFIEQVFKPFLPILDELIRDYLSDAEIVDILGTELGMKTLDNLQDFHDAKMEYEVLAGASLAAKRTMAQSMTLLTQIFENPQITDSLADINEEYIDWKEILSMWMEASEWKNKNDIIKPMTDAMKQKRAQQSAAAQAQSKAAVTAQSNQQKFEQKQQLEDQANDNRIKRDIVREVARTSGLSEAVEGVPNPQGLEGSMPQVE